jgi:hypothetical protein
MYEQKHLPLASTRHFIKRLLGHGALASLLMSGSLLLGIMGYHQLEGLSYVDAFVNAAMLMGGMGPVDAMHSDAAKIFAGCYALYCGLVLLVATGILAAPVLHRLLHQFHISDED